MKPISKQVRKALPLLKFIAKERDPRIRAHNLRKLGGDQIVFDALSEISQNYLNRKIQLPTHHSKIVSKPENLKRLRKFHCNKVRQNCKKRSNALQQTGGILPYLIPAAATVIDLILSNYKK